MSDFQALLDELGALAKALPAQGEDDKNIQAAAGGAGGEGDGKDGDGTGGEGDGKGGNQEEEDETFGKSFQVTLDDGTTVDAFDGTAMMKALNSKVARLEASNQALAADRNASLQVVTQSIELIKSLQGTVTKLQADVTRLAGAGAGRRAVVNVLDKPGTGQQLAKSEGLSGGDLRAKALEAQRAGRIGATEVARVDSYLGKSLQLPADLLHAIGAV